MQIRSLRHELDHIHDDDLHNGKTIQEAEGAQ
jgi:hypothetical protein